MAYILKDPEVFRINPDDFKKEDFPNCPDNWFIAQLQKVIPNIPIEGDSKAGWSCICYGGFSDEHIKAYSKYVNFIEQIRC